MEIIAHKYKDHENIINLLRLLQTLPASSAEVERGFSQLKLIKTNLRTQLSENKLTDLLSIKLLAAPIALFDPIPAIEHWNRGSSQPRRPNLRDGFKSQVLVDGEPAGTVADAAEPAAATATGVFTDGPGDIPDSESSDDSEESDEIS
jgi:hypothetical protein